MGENYVHTFREQEQIPKSFPGHPTPGKRG